jgi:CO/xanthine dehydrogenase FAD-binding subunit
MFTIKELVQPASIEEAYRILVSQRNNSLLGGCAFLRLGSKKIATAVDLSRLDLNYVKERYGFIEIGALTTLREVEVNPLSVKNFNGVLGKAVGNIVGVQLRNIITVGASVYARYGFSDFITALLVLNTEVELYKAGRVLLADFLQSPREKDILTRIFIKQDQRQASYQCMRKSSSDFPIQLLRLQARRRCPSITRQKQSVLWGMWFTQIKFLAGLYGDMELPRAPLPWKPLSTSLQKS